MFLFRYDRGHRGPYCVDAKWSNEMAEDHNDDYHPVPQEDGLDEFFYSACDITWCTSYDNLIDWFHGYNDLLEEKGFDILVVEVDKDEYHIGNCGRQAVTSRTVIHKAVKLEDFSQLTLRVA